MSDDEKKAGHPPAVKAGGMRIVQHKSGNSTKPAQDLEDVTGLTTPPNITPSTQLISGAPIKGNVDYTPEAVKVAHHQPPPVQVPNKIHHGINQPRKDTHQHNQIRQ